MSSQSWNAIPEERRKALAARLKARINEDGSDDDDELDKPQPKMSGSSGSSGKRSAKNLSQDLDDESGLLAQHSTKLESLETRIEKLLTLNERMEERSKKLEALVVQVAERVGVPHNLGGSSG